MKLEEKTISKNLLHHGRITDYYDDEVLLPNGEKTSREYVSHVGGSAVLPLDKDGNVYLVKQFRYPYGEEILEIPAGKREPNEDPLITAKRELKEETGYDCKEIHSYGVFYPTPGYSNEKLFIYKALVDNKGETHFDDTEFIDLVVLSSKEAFNMVINGQIKDGKTMYAICRYFAKK